MAIRIVRLGSARAAKEGLRRNYYDLHTNFSLGCYCEQEDRCHRSILRELLVEHGARVA